MKQIIEDLYPMNRCLLGEGYDNALLYLDKLVPLDTLEYPSGTEFGTWTVPEEWVVRDAWVKFNGRKILDYKKNPLCLAQGSEPFQGTITHEELFQHLHYSDEKVDAHPFEYKLYEGGWAFTMPKSKVYKKGKDGTGNEIALKEGEYEVFIDTEYRPGVMKVGVHTILGKTDKEILLFAHLDHPYQANDNLSGVAALVDLVKQIKPLTYEHTIKLVFCPETIGSIAYAHSEELGNVSFMMALDIVGNKHEEGMLVQKAHNKEHRVNDALHLAARGSQEGFRQGIFRSGIGSDEYVFNDPDIGVPGVMITTHPYPAYHTSEDTPDIIDYEAIKKVQYVVLKTIEYYEKDFKPVKNFKGPLHRSKYGIQTTGQDLNRSWDYLIYGMDGKRNFSRLCLEYGLNFEHTLERVEKLIEDGAVGSRPIVSEGTLDEITR